MPFAETPCIIKLLDYKDDWRSTSNFFSTGNRSKWDCEELVAWNYCTDVSKYPSRWATTQLNQFHHEWHHRCRFIAECDKRRRFVFCGWREWSWLRFTGVCLVSTAISARTAEFWRMVRHMRRSAKLCGRPSASTDDVKLEETRARYLAKY